MNRINRRIRLLMAGSAVLAACSGTAPAGVTTTTSPATTTAPVTTAVTTAPVTTPVTTPSASTPNIVLVVMDDMRWDALDSLPWLARRARSDGAWFTQAYASLPQCCPARASILTGRYVHNHDVWKSSASEKPGALGGHAGVRSLEDDTIATWLDDAGYFTGLVGKYANGYPAYPDSEGGVWTVPSGWDEWAAIYQPAPLGPVTLPEPLPPQDPELRGYTSFSIVYGEDGAVTRIGAYRSDLDARFSLKPTFEDWHETPMEEVINSTTVYTRIARSMIETHATEPFFVWLSLTAPHLNPVPTPANADAEVAMVDRTVNGYVENFATEDDLVAAGKPLWVRELPSMTSYTCAEPYSSLYKCADDASSRTMEADQRRTLLDSDAELRHLFRTLETTLDQNGTPLIETTYVIFTSDHGFMWGEHRIPHSKGVPYEEAIAVPFLVFGPDVVPGEKRAVVSLIDIAPTVLDWTGLDRDAIERASGIPLDGESLEAMLDGTISGADFTMDVRAGVLAESKQRTSQYEPARVRMPAWDAYMSARWKVIRYDKRHATVTKDPHGIWIEGYDLRADPFELQSLYVGEPPGGLKKTERILKRMVTCSGTTGPNSCSIPASGLVEG